MSVPPYYLHAYIQITKMFVEKTPMFSPSVNNLLWVFHRFYLKFKGDFSHYLNYLKTDLFRFHLLKSSYFKGNVDLIIIK